MNFRIPFHAVAALNPRDWTRAVPEDPAAACTLAALLKQMAIMAARSLPRDRAATAAEGMQRLIGRYGTDIPIEQATTEFAAPRHAADLIALASLCWLVAVRVRDPITEVICAEIGQHALHALDTTATHALHERSSLGRVWWWTHFHFHRRLLQAQLVRRYHRAFALLGSRDGELGACAEHYTSAFADRAADAADSFPLPHSQRI